MSSLLLTLQLVSSLSVLSGLGSLPLSFLCGSAGALQAVAMIPKTLKVCPTCCRWPSAQPREHTTITCQFNFQDPRCWTWPALHPPTCDCGPPCLREMFCVPQLTAWHMGPTLCHSLWKTFRLPGKLRGERPSSVTVSSWSLCIFSKILREAPWSHSSMCSDPTPRSCVLLRPHVDHASPSCRGPDRSQLCDASSMQTALAQTHSPASLPHSAHVLASSKVEAPFVSVLLSASRFLSSKLHLLGQNEFVSAFCFLMSRCVRWLNRASDVQKSGWDGGLKRRPRTGMDAGDHRQCGSYGSSLYRRGSGPQSRPHMKGQRWTESQNPLNSLCCLCQPCQGKG